MKTATIPSLRIEPEPRDVAEKVLQESETLSIFVEASIRESVARRQMQVEFLARGPASRRRAPKPGAV